VLIRRLAAAAALLTLVLITAGGLVTNTDSGLACPDWPLCFGSPLPQMVGGVAVEHAHRLIASAVGLITAALVVLTLRRARQGLLALAAAASAAALLGAAFFAAKVQYATGEIPAPAAALVLLGFAACGAIALRARELDGRLAVAALMLVILQGLLGGLTVLYRLPPTVLILHLGTSMLYLSAALVLAWRTNAGAPAALLPRGLLWVTAGAIYFQILLGATIRHTGAGLVCTDLPYCRGVLWPTGVHPAVHLHMLHRAFAFAVLALVAWSSVRVSRGSTGLVRKLALAAPALVLLQIVLGILTILTFKGLVPVTAHLLVGALALATYVSLLSLTRGAPGATRAASRGAGSTVQAAA
jgi:heme A synthase